VTTTESTIVLTKGKVITCTKRMGATSVGEPFGEHTKGTPGNISGEHEGPKNIYINLRGSHDNLRDGYFDPGSSNENSENNYLILSKFKR